MNGVLIHRKSIDLMLQALKQLIGAYKLFLVETVKEKDTFQKLAKELNVEDCILFAGFHENAAKYLPYFGILVLPSCSEGYPLALLKSANMGKKFVVGPIMKLENVWGRMRIMYKIRILLGLVNQIQEQ